jgi:hypothetical protein
MNEKQAMLKNDGALPSVTRQQLLTLSGFVALAVIIFSIFIAIAFVSTVFTGFDWGVIRAAILRMWSGQEIYQLERDVGVFNPPWYFVILSPLGFLPEKIGWSVVNTISIFSILLLANRYKLSKLSTGFLIASPPFFYNLVQGHIDVLMLLCLFLPAEYLLLAATAKPQILLPIALKLIRANRAVWLKAVLITSIVVALSFLFFGLWPLRAIELAQLQFSQPQKHNLLASIWPLQLIIAVPLILLGLERDEERFYLAAAPLMSSYASTGNYIGLLLAVVSALKWWQAGALILTWWVVALLW